MQRGLLGIVLLVACAGGNSLETTGAYTTLAPTGEGDQGSGGDTDEGDTTGDADPSTTGIATTDGSSSSGAVEESSSGGEGVPPQPATGWWSHCTQTSMCTDDLLCFANGAGDDGVCTQYCTVPGDPTTCGVAPDGTATPTCLNVGDSSICALDCSADATCPGGMLCLSAADDDGPIEICL